MIKLRHIGDSLIVTPTIHAIRQKYPEAFISCLVRQGCDQILHGCPDLDEILTTVPPEAHKRIPNWNQSLKLVGALRQRRFDWAFELSDNSRGRWLAMASGARHRVATHDKRWSNIWWNTLMTRQIQGNWKIHHRVEKDWLTVAPCLGLEIPPGPLIFQPPADVTPPVPIDPALPWVIFHPATRWKRKQWPRDRWISLGQRFVREGWQVLLSCGPSTAEQEENLRIQHELPGALNTNGTWSWMELAVALKKARLFVGVDTAAMHLAAACATPTVALFGPTRPGAWSPWKTRHLLPGQSNTGPWKPLPMEQISLDEVWADCLKISQSTPST
jgi:heptosyltransferase-3